MYVYTYHICVCVYAVIKWNSKNESKPGIAEWNVVVKMKNEV